MAVTSVTHVWSGDTWTDSIDSPRGYQSLYRVVSDDPNESAQEIRASGVPVLGDPYPNDGQAYCTNRTARRLDNTRQVWEVTVDYEVLQNEIPDSPLDEPVKYRWTAGQYTRPCVIDRNGNAVVNSAGDYFDPPPEIEDIRWSVNIQKNMATVPSGIISYAGKVNSAPFTVDGISAAVGTAKVIGLDIGELQERNDIQFRTVTLVIEFREEGYDLELLDQGFRIKDGTTLKDIIIEDENGGEQRPSSPVLLNGEGDRLSDPSPENAVFLSFEADKRLDFSNLPGVS